VIGTALALFLEATVRAATPLALAAVGETVAERAGVINLGIEGAFISGAFGALVGASAFGVAGGVVGAIAAGAVTGAIFAMFVIGLHTDQIITGTAMSLLALGLTGALYRAEYGTGGAALTTPTLHAVPIWGLSSLPIFGRALFAQPMTTYVVYAVTGATWWWLFRTHGGLALRACGEQPRAARAAGIRIDRVQTFAVIYAGALAGIAGGVLVIAQSGTFVEGMSAGRGFVSIAIVVLGRWHPAGVVFAALLFGAASALQTLFQSLGTTLPYQLFLALPYVLTLLALAGFAGRSRAPAALGKPTLE
jgi:simple sugar transport system permease protein